MDIGGHILKEKKENFKKVAIFKRQGSKEKIG